MGEQQTDKIDLWERFGEMRITCKISFLMEVILGGVLIFTPLDAFAEKRAVLIGIDRYSQVQPLVGSANDVQTMQRFLIRSWDYPPDNIRTLINEEATRQNILATITKWLIEGTSPGDEVFLYYSGHGYQQPDKNGDEADGLDETLVPVDTIVTENSSFKGMISDDEIGALLDRISDRKVTVLIDSCHSGTVTRAIGLETKKDYDPRYVRTPLLKRKSPPPTHVTRSAIAKHRKEEAFIGTGPNRIVWTSVSAAQKALVDQEIDQPGGVFTNRFVRGLQSRLADTNSNGIITHAELLDYLQRESGAYCKRHSKICPYGMTPTLEVRTELVPQPVAGSSEQIVSVTNLATDMLAHENAAGVRLQLFPSTTLRAGRPVTFSVTSERNGYLPLLDIDGAGNLTQLFPNQFSDRNGQAHRIRSGRPIIVPDDGHGFRIEARPPTGKGLVLAIVMEDEAPLAALLNQHKDLKIIASPKAYLSQVAQRLRRTWHQDRENRRLRWSLAETEYEIIR